MIKVSEISGHIFCCELKDGKCLTLLAGQSAIINKSQVSESLTVAFSKGRIRLEELLEETTAEEKTTTTKKNKGSEK